jgi:exopolyphosphatase / guanosine-5'-triphosphate,3'-diphosphate pyrophosphatase
VTAGRPSDALPAGPVAAVIDVGSNSVLLLVAAAGSRALRVVDEALVTTRLGTGLGEGGALDPAARARTRDAVAALAARARAAGAAEVRAFATGAARSARDGAEFAADLAATTGVPVEVLSGAREAELAYRAVAATLGDADEPLLVGDVGGRTTELSLGRGATIEATTSLPLGALLLTENHVRSDPPREILDTVAWVAHTVLARSALPARARASRAALVVSGGTATALAALDLGLDVYDGRRVHGHRMSGAVLHQLVARLGAMPAASRACLPGLDAGRGMILPAGAVVVERLARAAGVDTLRVSDHGVRHAYLRDWLAAEAP